MKRLTVKPRPQWQKKVEALGFHFHSANGEPYWDESACYQFSKRQIETLEEATNTLYRLCVEMVDQLIAKNQLDRLGIPAAYHAWIKQSWEQDELSLYGRFDLWYDGVNKPKLLEFNADTPTSLFEAAVVQWYWLEEEHPGRDQFNNLHAFLIKSWETIGFAYPQPLHFSCLKHNPEDFATVEYLRDTATQAGLQTRFVYVEDIG